MQIQEMLSTQNLIHRRQVAGYPIATQCCIWYRDQSFECSANQMAGFYMNGILVIKKTCMVIRLYS